MEMTRKHLERQLDLTGGFALRAGIDSNEVTVTFLRVAASVFASRILCADGAPEESTEGFVTAARNVYEAMCKEARVGRAAALEAIAAAEAAQAAAADKSRMS